MLRLLAEGEVIGMAVETERSVLGRYQGVPEDVAGIIARLGVPVVPVGISGSYDSGPRWAERSALVHR
jgi:1-acyl-sn-glycerol-3-phosphate acyltransferase